MTGAETPWRGRRRVALARVITYGGGLLLLLWLARAGYVAFVRREPWTEPFGFDPDGTCRQVGVSCGAITGLVVSWLSVAAGSALFLLLRFRAVVNRYRRTARTRPFDLVPTASGGIVGDVVGRNDLCQVIIDDLRDSGDRRPHVLVGGVGTGKTAVLVLLTHLLAQCGAVPVPVRLRDAQTDLDFQELARRRFHSQVDDALLSQGEGDRIWRHLVKNGQIVVLADGLEEALNGEDHAKDRDTVIRLAIARAREDRLPLVIASRPHAPLRGADAAIVDLEPLSRMAALDYLGREDSSEDRQRLNWIVETADVAEAPLFLRITRDLHERDLLRHLTHGVRIRGVNTRSLDRSALRLNLLDTWVTALVEGQLRRHVPLSRPERTAAVAYVSAMAAEGLRRDSLQVRFEDVVEAGPAQGGPREERCRTAGLQRCTSGALALLERRPVRVRLAATWGAQLGLVDAQTDSVSFHHSLLQSYLGSLVLDSVLDDEDFLRTALQAPEGPGRELLIALAFLSRRQAHVEAGSAGLTSPSPLPASIPPGPEAMRSVVETLTRAAADRKDDKSLDMWAAALEIDSVNRPSVQAWIAEHVERSWLEVFAADQRTLDEAKLGLVRRFGDALRQVQRRIDTTSAGTPSPDPPAYAALYDIGCREDSSYAVRHAVAQELGSGGDGAFVTLEPRLAVGLDIAAADRDVSEEEWRQTVMCAWLAPLLFSSVSDPAVQARARTYLGRWTSRVGHPDVRRPPGPPLPPSVEVALAQGFTYAANRRRRHPYMNAGARSHLVEQGGELLKRSGFWAAQLALVHALCLWALPDDPGIRRQDEAPTRRPARVVSPRTRVEGWLDSAGSQRDRGLEPGGPAERQRHPFVREAAALAVRALETGQPERFLWVDVYGVTSRIGSRAVGSTGLRRHNLWIPPSVGWSALDPRAQQLVADVLLLVNLADRGERAAEREARLRRANRRDLPPCLAGSRRSLEPDGAAAEYSEPGANCVGGCPFALCPYPPKGVQSYRAELSDAFCRRQQTLLGRTQLRRKAAPWQGTLPGELRWFWEQMACRARR
ncbi:hypothetical protein JOD57_000084 [Geodermatophilus bullaregiensis]|uniref:ATP-binding protein n=1 Tax=Geodermatophilus bullaregiensis TaxID=1564160 RepID=UPI001957EFF5|nr:ATP-binding protein [Geodermatophilus bullaregiensis]MBM7804247.1 hypothetical protein [Geodermatophilus bullaregiensis]